MNLVVYVKWFITTQLKKKSAVIDAGRYKYFDKVFSQ